MDFTLMPYGVLHNAPLHKGFQTINVVSESPLGTCVILSQPCQLFAPSGKYPFTFLLVNMVFLCLTPENEFGNQLVLDSRFLDTFRLFHSYELVRVQKSKW